MLECLHIQNNAQCVQQDSPEKRCVDLDIDSQALPRLLDQSLSVMTRRVELSTRDFVEANKMSTPPGETLARWKFTIFGICHVIILEEYIIAHSTSLFRLQKCIKHNIKNIYMILYVE